MNENFARLLLGSGENSPDIRYLTGISTPDEFICFEYDGQTTALLSDLEIDRGREQAKPGVAVLPEKDYGSSRLEVISRIADNLNCRAFQVPQDFPLALADRLRARGLTLLPQEHSFCPQRRHKTPAEAEAVLHSQRAGEAGFARAVEVLQEAETGKDRQLRWNNQALTSEILRAEIDCAILKHGALPTGTICAGSKQSAQPHNCGSGQLYAGTPIVMDIFPRSPLTGYWGDLTRTVVKGVCSDLIRRAYDAVLAAREEAKRRIAVGIKTAELHRIAAAELEKFHFFTGSSNGSPYGFFHGLGHGVGLEIHETPRLSPRSSETVETGDIFTIEPGLYYPEWGGIRLEDLIYIEPSGQIRCLTSAPDFLIIE